MQISKLKGKQSTLAILSVKIFKVPEAYDNTSGLNLRLVQYIIVALVFVLIYDVPVIFMSFF